MRYLGLWLCLLFPTGALAWSELPERDGFTLEIGVGLGGIQVGHGASNGGILVDLGIEPHSISLGGFLTPKLALMYRWSSAYYPAIGASGHVVQGVLGTHAIHAQYWISDRWFVSGGIGAAFFGNVLGRTDADPDILAGLGLAARVGFSFAHLKNHAWSLSIKVVSGIFAERVVVGQTLNLEYQWF